MFAIGPKPDFQPGCPVEAMRHLELARNIPGSEGQMMHLAIGLSKAFLPSPSVDDFKIEQTLENLSMDVCRAAKSGIFGARLAHLHRVLFDELKIAKVNDYYTESAHFLPEVITNHRGTSTMLAFFYVELARRSGLKANGLLIPGQVLVEVSDLTGNPMRIDVDDKGRILTDREIHQRLKRQRPQHVEGLDPEKLHFPAADLKSWLDRILSSAIYSAWSADARKTALALEIKSFFTPEDTALRLDLGMRLMDLGEKKRARPHLEAYLRSGVTGQEAAAVTKLLG